MTTFNIVDFQSSELIDYNRIGDFDLGFQPIVGDFNWNSTLDFNSFITPPPLTEGWKESKEGYRLRCIVSGFSRNDLSAETIDNSELLIKGTIVREEGEEEDHFSESYSLEKRFPFPKNILVETIECRYRAGVLLITAQKKTTSTGLKLQIK